MEQQENDGGPFHVGPTGENGMWKEGDFAQVSPFHAIKIGAEQAEQMNKQSEQHRNRMMAAELSRQDFIHLRVCPKCKFRPETIKEAASIHFEGDEADCAEDHGRSEHVDRRCLVCHYVWAENLPGQTWGDPLGILRLVSGHFHS